MTAKHAKPWTWKRDGETLLIWTGSIAVTLAIPVGLLGWWWLFDTVCVVTFASLGGLVVLC